MSEPEGAHRYYSQAGEDFLAWSLFGQDAVGFYVDVGAFDGVHLSNTKSFEEAGWDGLCIEAHPDFHPLCATARPNSSTIPAACVGPGGPDSIVLQTEPLGMLSGIAPESEADVRERYAVRGMDFDGFVPVEVPAGTLNDFLATHRPGTSHIDVLSVDVEGTEVDVLRGLDLTQISVRVIVVEATSAAAEAVLRDYLGPFGYQGVRRVGSNVFFVTAEDAETIFATPIRCRIEPTVHPRGLDATHPGRRGGRFIGMRNPATAAAPGAAAPPRSTLAQFVTDDDIDLVIGLGGGDSLGEELTGIGWTGVFSSQPADPPRTALRRALENAAADHPDARRTLLVLDAPGREVALLTRAPHRLRKLHAIQVTVDMNPTTGAVTRPADFIEFLHSSGFLIHAMEPQPARRTTPAQASLRLSLLLRSSPPTTSHSAQADALARIVAPELVTAGRRELDARRMEHLATLGLPMANTRVLELGAGVGNRTGFFLDRGCSVTTTESVASLFHVLRGRHPHVHAQVLQPAATPTDESWDIVVVVDPNDLDHALDAVAARTDGILILSVATLAPTPADDRQPFTRAWIMQELQTRFAFVYTTVTQPSHPDFPNDWEVPAEGTAGVADFEDCALRAVFIASRKPLDLPTLTTELPMRQPSI